MHFSYEQFLLQSFVIPALFILGFYAVIRSVLFSIGSVPHVINYDICV